MQQDDAIINVDNILLFIKEHVIDLKEDFIIEAISFFQEGGIGGPSKTWHNPEEFVLHIEKMHERGEYAFVDENHERNGGVLCHQSGGIRVVACSIDNDVQHLSDRLKLFKV